MPTLVLPPPALLPLLEVAHALGLPATAADDAHIDARLTLYQRHRYYIQPRIFYLTAPLFRFFVPLLILDCERRRGACHLSRT